MEKKYIDLHIHSIYSDGDKTPREILKMAEKLKLEYISITDHENCKAYEDIEKEEIRKLYHGKVIAGCELMTSFNDVMIEILGYYIEPKIINEWYDKKYAKVEIQKRDSKLLEILLQKIQKENLKIEEKICLPDEIPYTGYFKYMIYEALKKERENEKFFKKYNINNYEEFIRKGLSNAQNPLFIQEGNHIAGIQEIVDLIHKAGGLTFVAHLYKYQVENHIEFLKNLIETVKGIDGVECYYSSFSEEQTQKLEKFCETNKLLKSGGSDYHGKIKPHIQMGKGTGDNKIKEDIIEKWTK